ncbi:MAG: hypothetical protein ACFFBD_21055 [Candidatus Hodarchaeota archaeon]
MLQVSYHNKGYTLEKIDKIGEAIIYYKKTLEIDPENSNSRDNLRR